MKSYPVITNRKIRVAIVGCGRISKNHFGSLEKHQDNIELIAICEAQQTVLSEHEKKYNIKGYLELANMLENEDLDLVVICTPSGMHAEQTELCATHGVNVMTEKPMATLWSDGVKMVKACDKAGVRLFVVKQNRKNATLQLLKRAIKENRFGKIHMVHLNVFWTRPQEYYDQAPWRGTWEFDGGALMNQASHYVDLLDWLIGPIDKVQAMMSTTRDIEVEDTATATIEFQSGITGSLEITTAARPIDFEASLSLVCEKGLAQIGGIAVNELQVYTPDPDACTKNSEDFSGNVYGHGHVKIYEEIVATLRERKKYSVTFDDAFATIQLLNAFYLADENQSWVDVSSSGDSIRLGKLDNDLANLYRTHPQIN